MKESHTVEDMRIFSMTNEEKAAAWEGIVARTGIIDPCLEVSAVQSEEQALIASPFVPVRNEVVSRLHNGGWMIPLGEHVSALRRGKSIAVSSILLIALSTGTSALAQSSLPGTTLYPIKVNINEKIEQLFTFTLEAKAELENRLTLRRLDEIQALMQRNMLTPALEKELDRRIDLHSKQFEMYLTALPHKEKN